MYLKLGQSEPTENWHTKTCTSTPPKRIDGKNVRVDNAWLDNACRLHLKGEVFWYGHYPITEQMTLWSNRTQEGFLLGSR